jgi:hypothetical protein
MLDWLHIWRLPSKPITKLKELPQDAGVYYIMALGVVLYVGKTKNLRNRWQSSHHRYQQFKLLHPFGRLHYRVLAADKIHAYEKVEISKFQPQWNGTARVTFWQLCGLFVAVWGRVMVYALLLLGAIAVIAYIFLTRT